MLGPQLGIVFELTGNPYLSVFWFGRQKRNLRQLMGYVSTLRPKGYTLGQREYMLVEQLASNNIPSCRDFACCSAACTLVGSAQRL